MRGDVRLWHVSDMAFLLRDVRSQGQSGKHLLAASISPFDPEATLAALYGSAQEAAFEPLSKYPFEAVSGRLAKLLRGWT